LTRPVAAGGRQAARIRVRPAPGAPAPLRDDFDRIRREFKLPEGFPGDVEAEAEQAAANPAPTQGREDLRELAFVTIDPPGSLDLDQAMLLERRGDGFLVRYAIADVGALVARGGPVEREAWNRGTTVYLPDERIPLYPTSLSEGAASLLPGEDRAAIVFSITLDSRGCRTSAAVRRAVVRSHRRLAYGEAEVPLLREVGELRLQRARERGAVTLNDPEQVVKPDPESPHGYRLEIAKRLPDEDWNAEISLLAGMTAAEMMTKQRLGFLRTMGGPDPYREQRLRAAARGLHVDWPDDEPFGRFVMRLDPSQPPEAALLEEAHEVMGHAGYVFFEGAPPPGSEHAGIGAPYAHTTAPLRRLADRYVLELLVGEPPDRDALQRLPDVMTKAGGLAAHVERAVVDLMETRLLEDRIGGRFTAIALENDRRGTVIRIADPPVRARLHADPPPREGTVVEVELVRADPRSRSLEFRPA
jgi:exoribonuclease R